MGYLYNILIKVNPGKSLKRLLPFFITSIYKEINIYRAGIMADIEILPGDCILVWNIHLLSYSLTKVKDFMLAWKKELFVIIKYIQLKCKGSFKMVASDIAECLLYTLIAIYIIDHLMHKKDEFRNEFII